MMNIESDVKHFIEQITASPKRDAIVAMFTKGPSSDYGFMWTNNFNNYWTDEEYDALREVGMMVIDKGWDSGGYGLMMRRLQHYFITNI